jgi:hypothetical protein
LSQEVDFMQHVEAIRYFASEKYLLDELTPQLREEFEEHFFGCAECARDVRAGSAFIDPRKSALSEAVSVKAPEPAPVRRLVGWGAWRRPAVVVPGLAALMVVIGYQNFVAFPRMKAEVAQLRDPRVIPSASLISARSDRVPLVVVRPKESFLLFVDITADSRFSSYICELYSPGGKFLWSIPVSAEAAKDTLQLLVPPGDAEPGEYSLAVNGIVAGQKETVLARYPFELQRSK